MQSNKMYLINNFLLLKEDFKNFYLKKHRRKLYSQSIILNSTNVEIIAKNICINCMKCDRMGKLDISHN